MAHNGLRRLIDVFRRTPLHPPWLPGKSKRVKELLRSLARGRIVDVCSADRWIRKHLDPTAVHFALDHSAIGVIPCESRPDAYADDSHLPFGDNSLDAVVLLEALEHLRHPREALIEIAQALRPGGRLRLSMSFLVPVHDAPNEYQRFTRHGLVREVETGGLKFDLSERDVDAAGSAGPVTSTVPGGMTMEAVKIRHPSVVLIPFLAFAVLVVNLTAWLGSRLLPDWPAASAGHFVLATKS